MTIVDRIKWAYGIRKDYLDARAIARLRDFKAMRALSYGFGDLAMRTHEISKGWYKVAQVFKELADSLDL